MERTVLAKGGIKKGILTVRENDKQQEFRVLQMPGTTSIM